MNEKKHFKLVDYNDYVEDWSEYEELTPKQAIVAYCHQCCCYQPSEVKQCVSKSCLLWLFRQKWYRTPKRSGMSEENRIKHSNMMKNLKANKI